MLFFDSHVHSHHAHDSAQTLEEIYCAALKKGLAGVSVTAPADIWYLEKDHTFEHISSALEAVDLWRLRMCTYSHWRTVGLTMSDVGWRRI